LQKLENVNNMKGVERANTQVVAKILKVDQRIEIWHVQLRQYYEYELEYSILQCGSRDG